MSFSLSSVRCNRCIKYHRKCDKKLPHCTSCNPSKGKKCIYENYSNNKFHQFTLDNTKLRAHRGTKMLYNITQEELGKLYTKKNKTIENNGFENGQEQDKSMIFVLPSGMNRNNNIESFLSKLSAKGYFRNVMMLYHYSATSKTAKEVHFTMRVTKMLMDELKKPNHNISIPLSPALKKQDTRAILLKAKELFFRYQNSAFPVFIEYEFEWDKRPLVVKLAILVAGLAWLKPDPVATALMNRYAKILKQSFIDLRLIPPTLSNLQAVLTIILGGSSLPWLRSIYDRLVAYCYRASFILGLHLSIKGISNKMRKERALVYSRIGAMYNSINIFKAAAFSDPFVPKSLGLKYNKLANLTSFPDKKMNINEKDLLDSINMIRSSMFNEITCMFFAFRFFKVKYENIENPIEELSKTFNDITNKTYLLHMKYISIFEMIKASKQINSTTTLLSEITSSQDHVHYTFHFFQFMLYSIKLTRHSLMESQLITHDFFISMLSEAKNVIYYALKLPLKYSLNSVVTVVTQCSIFLNRFHNGDKELIRMVEASIVYLRMLKRIPAIMHIAKFNEQLVTFVGKR